MFCPHSLEWFSLNQKTLPRTSNAGGLQPKTHPTFTVQRLCSVLPGRHSFHFETGKSSAIEARGVYSLSKSRQLLYVVLIKVHPKSHDASEKELFHFWPLRAHAFLIFTLHWHHGRVAVRMYQLFCPENKDLTGERAKKTLTCFLTTCFGIT